MKQRILSSIIILSVVVPALYFFKTAAAAVLVAAFAALALWEFYGLLEKSGYKPLKGLGAIFGALIVLGVYLVDLAGYHGREGFAVMPALAVVIVAIRMLWIKDLKVLMESFMSTVFGLFYVPMTLQFLIVLPIEHGERNGIAIALWIVAVVKVSDSTALFTGKAIGKHKLAPTISPKKTWEGAGGCIVGGIATGLLVRHFLADYFPMDFSLVDAGIFAALLSAVAIVSDLVESALKRQANTKDSGALVPGLGGFLDIADSLLLTAPLGFILFTFAL